MTERDALSEQVAQLVEAHARARITTLEQELREAREALRIAQETMKGLR